MKTGPWGHGQILIHSGKCLIVKWENPSACPRREKYLIKIFKKSLSNLQSSDQLKFSRNHLDIIDAIGNHSGLEIDNIDHHHDIFYRCNHEDDSS